VLNCVLRGKNADAYGFDLESMLTCPKKLRMSRPDSKNLLGGTSSVSLVRGGVTGAST